MEGMLIFLDQTFSVVKIGDWGFATIYKADEKIETACGSLGNRGKSEKGKENLKRGREYI
jgi:hypothetical protein